MSGGAQSGRARSKQVDYSDFYLPDAPSKRSARADDDFSDEDDEDDVDVPLKLSKLKPVAAKSKSVKSAKSVGGGGGKKEGVAAKKPGKKKAEGGVPKKSKKRAHASDASDASDDDDDSDGKAKKAKKKKRDADDAAAPVLKRKSKVAETKEKAAAAAALKAAAKDKKREYESSSSIASNGATAFKPAKKTPTLAKVDASALKAPSSGAADLSDVAALRKKYEALRELRETESERLLQDAKALALEEKKTYERMISKLKKEVSALSSRLQDDQVKREKEIEKLQREHKLRLEALERKHSSSSDDSHGHRKRIKELEAQLSETRRHGKAGGRAGAGSRAAEETIQLAQATKLLEIYRLVTSTNIQLIETAEDGDEDTAFTDVMCTTTDSITGKQFHFDLGVPGDDDDEIEYLPSETPNKDVKAPSYLQDEISFTRSEMTKFMRTILDVVIRKKTSDARSGR